MKAPAGNERRIVDLFSDLLRGFERMVRDEIQLAKAEISQKISQAILYAILLGVGGCLAFAGLLALLAACVAALAQALPVWLAGLLVGLVVIGLGLATLILGVWGLKREKLRPRQTIETVKEGVEWAKRQV